MKYILIIFAIFFSFDLSAQDPAFVVVYKSKVRIGPRADVRQASVFDTKDQLEEFLQSSRIDSTRLVGIYNLKNGKKLSFTQKKVERTIPAKVVTDDKVTVQ